MQRLIAFTTTPIYPGQTIPVRLIVNAHEINTTSSYLWRDVSVFIDPHDNNNEPCNLLAYQPSNWRKFMQNNARHCSTEHLQIQ